MERKKGTLYQCTADDILEEVSLLAQKVAGKTVEQHLKTNEMLLDELKTLRLELKKMKKLERDLLNKSGVERVEKIQVINPHKEYASIKVNKDNIIKEIAYIDKDSVIIDSTNVPEDVADGYYRYNPKNKKIELDIELKEVLYDL